MATILEMKQQLEDLRAQIASETEAGLKLAANMDADLKDVEAQSAKIDRLQIQAKLLEQQLENSTEDGKKNINPVDPPKKGGFENMAEFLNAVRAADGPGHVRDSRLKTGLRNAATGANEKTDVDGGYLIPPEYADGILDFVKEQSVLYPQVRRVQIEGNRLVEIYLDQKDLKPGPSGSRHGGILAYWKSEADQYTAVKAKFAERTTQVDKLTAYCPVTEEMLQDYPAIESVLNDLVAREFAFKVDCAIINGTGTGNEPIGLLASGNSALVTVSKEAEQTALITTENILKMYNGLIAQQRANAAWYINQDLELLLMQTLMPTGSIKTTGAESVEKIAGTFGVPLYTPPGAYGNEYATMLGKRVIPLEHCATAGEKGDIILADMSQYLIVERTGVVRQSSVHVRFDYDETVFKFTWRLGGRPDWPTAIKGRYTEQARSPYVVLEKRSE